MLVNRNFLSHALHFLPNSVWTKQVEGQKLQHRFIPACLMPAISPPLFRQMLADSAMKRSPLARLLLNRSHDRNFHYKSVGTGNHLLRDTEGHRTDIDVVFWDHHYVTYHESLPPCTHLRRARKAGMHPLNHIIPKTSVRRLFCFYPWIYSQKSLIGSTKQLLGLDDKVLMSPENRGFILQRALI